MTICLWERVLWVNWRAMVMLYATSVFDLWLRAFTMIPDFNIFFIFLPKTSTLLQPLPVRCADDSCLCSLWIFAVAAGNIWSEGFRMFPGASDWRTCRCSWLFKVVKMWRKSCAVGEELKSWFFFEAHATRGVIRALYLCLDVVWYRCCGVLCSYALHPQ